jgi:hypothetical protein
MDGDINLANLIYAVMALLLVAGGFWQSRRADPNANLGRLIGYMAIWVGAILAVAFVYQSFPGLFRA